MENSLLIGGMGTLVGVIYASILNSIKDVKKLQSETILEVEETKNRVTKLESFNEHKVEDLFKRIDDINKKVDAINEYVHKEKHDEIDVLQQVRDALTVIHADYKEIFSENEKLKKQLSIKS
jgi:hypothetical protein